MARPSMPSETVRYALFCKHTWFDSADDKILHFYLFTSLHLSSHKRTYAPKSILTTGCGWSQNQLAWCFLCFLCTFYHSLLRPLPDSGLVIRCKTAAIKTVFFSAILLVPNTFVKLSTDCLLANSLALHWHELQPGLTLISEKALKWR